MAAAERARLHELAPVLELLAERRGPDGRRPGRPGVGQRRRERQPGQRADPPALRPAHRKRSWPIGPTCSRSVMPDYPPFSKRFIRDDGAWARTIMRDDVDLVTSPIAEITPEGVRTEDGTLHEADVLIYGTGFTASDFLMPMRIVGRDGVELHDRWKGDARAYLGDHPARLPEPVPALRAQHQHRRERQHHLLLGVRGAPRGRAASRRCSARAPRRWSPRPGGPRRLQRARSTPRTSRWRGACRR